MEARCRGGGRTRGSRVCPCAGIGWAERTVGKQGPAQLAPFETVVRVNLIGTFNVLRLAAAAMAANEPDAEGERGVVVMTASIAAFDGPDRPDRLRRVEGRRGRASPCRPRATWPRLGIRVCTIAPGLFDTPLLAGCPRRRARRSARRSPSRRASAVPTSTRGSPATSPRTRC